MNKIEEKKVELEVLGSVIEHLNSLKDGYTKSYEKVGEEQAKDWKTGELKWEDEAQTIPMMRNLYDYLPKPEETLTEKDRHAIAYIDQLIEDLGDRI